MTDPANALRRQMKTKAFSQADLAREIGVSAPFICEVLAGRKRASPKILDYLGIERAVTYRRNGKARK